MSVIWKIGYVICRQTALFGLPGMRKLRNIVYNRYLGTSKINVDDFVRMYTAHANPGGAFRKIGCGLHISRNAEVDFSGGVTMGTNVTVSENAKIYTHDHIVDGDNSDWRKNDLVFSPIDIGDNAWIGADAIVLQRVSRIGEGAVIAAGSVVTRDVDDFMIVAGNPAKPVRRRAGKFSV